MRSLMSVLLISLFLSMPVVAQAEIVAPKSIEGSQQLCVDFVQTLENKGAQMAFLDYRPLFHVSAAEVTAMREAIKQQMFVSRPTYGPPLKFDVLQSKTLGESMLRVDMAEVFLHNVVFWQCTFFKPQDVWKLNAIEMSVDPDFVFP